MSDEEILDLGCKQAGKSHWDYLDDLGRAQRKAALECNGCTVVVFWDEDYEDEEEAERPEGYSKEELRILLNLPVKYKSDTYELISEGIRKHLHWGYLDHLKESQRKDAIAGKGCTVVVFWDNLADASK
jgi:hypothetical protein